MKLSNREIREVLLYLARFMTIKVNLSMLPRVNVVESTMTSRWRDFVWMNPPIILGSKVEVHPLVFLDGLFKVLSVMGLHLGRRKSLVCMN